MRITGVFTGLVNYLVQKNDANDESQLQFLLVFRRINNSIDL